MDASAGLSSKHGTDGLHTRWAARGNIAQEIKGADAEYVLALKGKQETFHREVKESLDDAVAGSKTWCLSGAASGGKTPQFVAKKVVEKDHGRLETREYFQSTELGWFADRSKGKGVQSVGLVQATREIQGKTSMERRYFISNLPLDFERFALAVRDHWGIENKLHWVLDVHFQEDQSRA